MRAVTLPRSYNIGDIHNYFFMSDLHMESPVHDRKLLIKELNYALRENADIFIGGDVLDLLTNGDRKRYTPSSTKYGDIDATINEMIHEAVQVLTPYAKNIKVMLCGNHEASAVKYHSIDPIAFIIYELNKLEGVSIKYLGYQGYIRLSYKYEKGSSTYSFDIKAHHGTGGNSEITKGTITMNRFMTAHLADLYWFGHTHGKLVLPQENMTFLNRNGRVEVRGRRGIITGAYIDIAKEEPLEYKGRPTSYKVNYGDTKRTLQSTGGIMMRLEFLSIHDIPDIKIIC